MTEETTTLNVATERLRDVEAGSSQLLNEEVNTILVNHIEVKLYHKEVRFKYLSTEFKSHFLLILDKPIISSCNSNNDKEEKISIKKRLTELMYYFEYLWF